MANKNFRVPISHRYPSTYLGTILWGVIAFGVQPSLGSFTVHFFITPFVIIGLIWLAHWEGRNQ